MKYDVAIIGAGIIGSSIARYLSQYKLNLCIIEKESDVSCGTSKANSGIIHAGYDPDPGTLMAKLNVRGNELYPKIAEDLHFHFKRTGSHVIAFSEEEKKSLEELYKRGKKNGVPGLKIIESEELHTMESSLSEGALASLYAPSAGIISPYEATWAVAESAVLNGVHLFLETEVREIHEKDTEGFFTLITGKGNFKSRFIINAAGLFADEINQMAGGRAFFIKPRRGEYSLLDSKCCSLAKSVLFQTPTSLGKGVLVTPTVDYNILIGPSADEDVPKDSFATTKEGQDYILEKAEKTIVDIPRRNIINSFSGSRAIAYELNEDGSEGKRINDFIIEEDEIIKGLITVGGISSPGLASAPAIAEYVGGLIEKAGLVLKKNSHFNPIRKGLESFKFASQERKEELLKEDPLYGRIICRCEMITEAEIVKSIHSVIGAKDLDGVKRRTRAQMGRCQGGFCMPRITEILSRELSAPMISVTKNGRSSFVLHSRTREQ